ncbi:hypothetical protein [Azospirillum sp. ST 5-10]
MTDDSYTRYHRTTRTGSATIRRVRAYLMSRPSESWMFFFAGVVAGALLG